MRVEPAGWLSVRCDLELGKASMLKLANDGGVSVAKTSIDDMNRRFAPPPTMTSDGWPARYGESLVVIAVEKVIPMSKCRELERETVTSVGVCA